MEAAPRLLVPLAPASTDPRALTAKGITLLENLTESSFSDLVGDTFVLYIHEDQNTEVTLIEVKRMGSAKAGANRAAPSRLTTVVGPHGGPSDSAAGARPA